MYNELETTVRRGQVYYVNYNDNYAGSEQAAGRPAIIVSNDLNNKHSDTFEIVYLTTQTKSDLPTHTIIRSTKRVSTALCEQIMTVSNERLGDYMCTITDSEMAAVDACLAISLGLNFETTEHYEEEAVEPKREAPTEPEYDPDDTIDDDTRESLEDILNDMYTDLVAVTAERDVYKKLYTELLERMMTK